MNTKFKIILLTFVILTAITQLFALDAEDSEANLLKKLTHITLQQAEKQALSKAKGKIIEEGLEIENGFLVFSFDIKTNKGNIMEVQINAKNGKIILKKEETEKEEALEAANDEEQGNEADEKDEIGEKNEKNIKGSIRTEKHFKLSKEAKINKKAAINSALKLVEGKVKEVELEKEDNYLVYKVLIIYNNEEWEVIVDAGNGNVLNIDMED